MFEFYFDCSSPWTYLAFHTIPPIAAEFGETVVWKPILVGGVFNKVNPSVYASRENPVPAKAAWSLKDLKDWARYTGLEIRMPPSVFPVNSVKAMRGCIWLDAQGRLPEFARAVFEAYWGRDEDISKDDVLTAICKRVGVEPTAFFEAISREDIKAKLRENTDELIARGGFGSPTIFINGDDMYFGNDRAPLIRAALERNAARKG
jgi:2-hydroxychromene-2-carboxylate isomerase